MAIGTQIPAQIVSKIVPTLSKQIDNISQLAEKTMSDCMNLAPNTTCNDPHIKQIKQQLKDIQTQITSLSSLIVSTNNIANTIQTLSTVATALKIVQLAIPMVPGVPSGPITELINIFTKLIENSKSSIDSLKGAIGNIQTQFTDINSSLASSINKLGSICNDEQFEVSADVVSLVNQSSLQDLQNRYTTNFYTPVNVSQEDIDFRLDTIQELLDNQIDVIQNLVEAPSKVLTGATAPNLSVGNVNDYFVNTVTQQIYGPKTDTGWGTPVNQ
jgi:hypothetical protein